MRGLARGGQSRELLSFEEAEDVLEEVDGPNGEGWYHGICPAHSDDHPSLAYKEDEDTGVLVVYCHAGCTPREIIRAIGELLT